MRVHARARAPTSGAARSSARRTERLERADEPGRRGARGHRLPPRADGSQPPRSSWGWKPTSPPVGSTRRWRGSVWPSTPTGGWEVLVRHAAAPRPRHRPAGRPAGPDPRRAGERSRSGRRGLAPRLPPELRGRRRLGADLEPHPGRGGRGGRSRGGDRPWASRHPGFGRRAHRGRRRTRHRPLAVRAALRTALERAGAVVAEEPDGVLADPEPAGTGGRARGRRGPRAARAPGDVVARRRVPRARPADVPPSAAGATRPRRGRP